MDKLFIFDLDDTIIENNKYYNRALIYLLGYVDWKFGNKAPNPYSTLKLQYEIDSSFVKEQGFSMNRFPNAVASTKWMR